MNPLDERISQRVKEFYLIFYYNINRVGKLYFYF